MVTVIGIPALVLFGLVIWKTPPVVRMSLALTGLVVVAYLGFRTGTSFEHAYVHNVYFRQMSVVFAEFDRLAKAGESAELARRLGILNKDFSRATIDETAFATLVDSMTTREPSRNPHSAKDLPQVPGQSPISPKPE